MVGKSAKSDGKSKEEDEFVKAYCNLLKTRDERHNLVQQIEAGGKNLKYSENEAQYVAKCLTQMFILPKAVKEFGSHGINAAKKEVKQLHDRRGFRVIVVDELTRREKERAQDGLMFVTEKRSGEMKGRLAYNGKPTRAWIG